MTQFLWPNFPLLFSHGILLRSMQARDFTHESKMVTFYRVVLYKTEGDSGGSLVIQRIQQSLFGCQSFLVGSTSRQESPPSDSQLQSTLGRTWNPQKWTNTVKIYLKKREDLSLQSTQSTGSQTGSGRTLLYTVVNSAFDDRLFMLSGDGVFVESKGVGGMELIFGKLKALLMHRQTAKIEGFAQQWGGWNVRCGVLTLGLSGNARGIVLEISYNGEQTDSELDTYQRILSALLPENANKVEFTESHGLASLSETEAANQPAAPLSPSATSALVTIRLLKSENLMNI